jgi:uncharacterized membrane protein (UPF0127 family)
MESLYCVFNRTNETFLGLQVGRTATSFAPLKGFARLKGLLRRPSLRPGEGLWVVPSRGVHTLGLLSPIDVVYLDRENKVVYLREHLTPLGLGRLRFDSFSVLELPAHTIFSTNTCVGDQLLICPPARLESLLGTGRENAPARSACEERSGGICESDQHDTSEHPAAVSH